MCDEHLVGSNPTLSALPFSFPHRAQRARGRLSKGVRPRRATTDKAAGYPPALPEVLPAAEHVTGNREQQCLERDHISM